jgi:hypothetical protein
VALAHPYLAQYSDPTDEPTAGQLIPFFYLSFISLFD